MKKYVVWILVPLLTVAVSLADEPQKAAEKKADAPSMEQAMAAWAAAAMPGEAHKKLGIFVGSWDTMVRLWMAPDAPAQESKGHSENRWALDGRWVEQQYQGEFMGERFSGIGYTGYDNIKKKYVGTWMDNMSTGVMMMSGTADAGGKMIFSGTMDDPLTGKQNSFEQTVVIVDDDHHIFEMYAPGLDGKVFKNMEIHYKRKK